MGKKYFTDEKEIQKRKELTELMNEWKKVIKTKDKIVFADTGEAQDAIEYFNTDGFFPGYFSHKNRVLFIGRESRGPSGGDRIESDLEGFKDFDASSSYWRRLLYLAYGIRHGGKLKFEQLPSAAEIIAQMRETGDYGFAIMNISKYSNDSDFGGTADYSLINRFLQDSELDKRNFVLEEIDLLDPTVIITAHLWNGGIKEELLNSALPEKNFSALKRTVTVKDGCKACLYDFALGRKKILLIDLYHFSSRKSDKDDFYSPVMKLLFSR